MLSGWRYFSYLSAVRNELAGGSPVHLVSKVMSSPYPFSAVEPGRVMLPCNGTWNHFCLTPTFSGSSLKFHGPESEIESEVTLRTGDFVSAEDG